MIQQNQVNQQKHYHTQEGFTPKDKDGNPLKPVDPTDPTKGYVVPDLPTDPSQDTPINYVKDTQKAKTTFVDEKGNPIPGVFG